MRLGGMLAALGKHGIVKRSLVSRVLPEVLAGAHERMLAPGKHATQTCRPYIEAISHTTPPLIPQRLLDSF